MTQRSHSTSLMLTLALCGLSACSSEQSPTSEDPSGVSAAGTGNVTAPSAGQNANTGGTAGSQTNVGKTAGTGATGGAGAPASAAGGAGAAAAAGSGGSIATAGAGAAGTAAAAGSSGSAAGAGAAGSAAAAGSGGSAAGSGGSAGGSVGPKAGNGGTVMPGQGGTLNTTHIVGPGQTFDGGGKRYTAGRALGNGSQDEGQQPMFRVEAGGTLKNVVLGAPAADGIHTYGNATLENIVWEDIGEDAMTIKESGTVTLNGGSASNGEDKVFQINAPSTFKVSNFTARKAGKFIRQNGDTTFKVAVEIDSCDISQMDEAIFRTDSRTSTVKMTNTRYSQIGDQLFVGVSAGNITQSNNMEY